MTGIDELMNQPFKVRITERMRVSSTPGYSQRFGVEVYNEFGTITYASNSLTEEQALALALNVLANMKGASLDV